MKITAVTICHYGSIYLNQAIKAVSNVVDEHLVFYTANSSHGHATSLQCPDTKRDIERAIMGNARARLIESSGFKYEGQQRDFAYTYARTQTKADLLLVIDYDEIWPEETLRKAIEHIKNNPEEKTWLINFSHLFRSFDWICKDNMWPIRFINFRATDTKTGYIPKELGNIFHLGYCIPDSWMKYKISCHGHSGEWKQEWYKEKWQRFPQSVKDVMFGGEIMKDVHPTCDDTWNPEPFNREDLPFVMHEHAYYMLPRGECVV